MPLSIQFPSFISPEIIPGLPFRWYGLMYVFAFATAYFLYRRQVRSRHFPMDEETLSSMFFWCILSLLLGARIFSTFVYENPATNIYLREPWLIFWPFRNGQFTGLEGMSYHGGVLGCLICIIVWSKRKHYDLREIGDMFACAIPLGYTFGRLGNFFNQELYGRVTDSPLGMIFPKANELFNPSLDWVRELAEKTGVPIPGDPRILINLPRYPTQLFEAFFEGIVLWFVLWMLRKRNPYKGFLFGAYVFGYSIIRFIIEYFREPDTDIGYRIQLGRSVTLSEIGYLHPLLSFSTGQILSLLMILAALIWWIIAAKLPDSQFVYDYSQKDENSGTGSPCEDKKSKKNTRRNLRKKLR
ncbi:MAG: prolipoprotein diacylglyceryl transferase [Spirochaetaceae bacterium]|jgi:phosphatidylglycerol:prolipoprotein diacylglycerol transferase|nr:prolipoprotein diacylglyceryl transferase [Spirochaetaceae bacterium]